MDEDDSVVKRIILIYTVLIIFLSQCHSTKNLKSKIYYLSQDCKPADDTEGAEDSGGGTASDLKNSLPSPRKHTLTLDIGGAAIFSHQPDAESYPENFQCQVIAHAVDAPKILVQIPQLSIPDYELDPHLGTGCFNAIWGYDSNTPYTTAMTQANGQVGLCKNNRPKPFFTKQQYFTFIFMTTKIREKDKKTAGFQMVLSSAREVPSETGVCPDTDFLCADKKFCAPLSLRCDNVANCLDGSDEDFRIAKCGSKETLLHKFLSLGVTASIAIAAGSVVLVLVCIVATTCCCYRWVLRKFVPGSQNNRGGGAVLMTVPLEPLGTPQSQRATLVHHNGSTTGSLVYTPYKKNPSPRPTSSIGTNSSYQANYQGLLVASRPTSDHLYSYPGSAHSGNSSATGSAAPPYPMSTHSHLHTQLYQPPQGYHRPHMYREYWRPGETPAGGSVSGRTGCHTPTSSRSAKSARSGRSQTGSMVTYTPAGRAALTGTTDRIQYPVQL